ncbi:MAG: hypothetical protein K2O32_11110 [Acetatifactor sp.]|nr:hypothetical protein [Acetatifactor sp.]
MPKKLKLIAVVCLSVNIMAVFLLVYILQEGSGKGGENPYIKDLTSEIYAMPRETGQSMGQSAEESVEENNTEESIEETDISPLRYPFVDFSYIEENHEILEYDICTVPQYDWENTLLGENEELRSDAEEHEKFAKWCNSLGEAHVPLDLDLEYFPFDFNDDGLEDYLVCTSSWDFCGSLGNLVRIYVQEEGGTLKEVLYVTAPLHVDDGIHARFTVLNEKTDGYYAIVLTSNRILRYDKDTGKYEFHDGE